MTHDVTWIKSIEVLTGASNFHIIDDLDTDTFSIQVQIIVVPYEWNVVKILH